MSFIKKIKHNVENSKPAGYIVNKSKQAHLPGFHGIPLFDVARFFLSQVKTVGMTERASAIAFNFVMAIPPAMIFLFTLIPYMPISKGFEEELYRLIRDTVPGEKDNEVIINFLRDFINNPRNHLLSFGFLLSLYFSSNAIMGVMRSFDKNYIGFKKRTGVQKRLTAIKITLVLYVYIFATLLLFIGQGSVLEYLGIQNETTRKFIFGTRWLFIVLLVFGCISFIYRHAPAVHKKWRMLSPGSIIATVLTLIFTMGFSWWVSRFGNYNQLYGSISTILILMGLIFVNSLVLLIGFELNVSINSLRKIADERKDSPADGSDKPI
ncbi:MAG: YihY/virulence factor BrkB family protein [Chitinophagaceae bacterium]